jgi:hypothetical protein
MKEGDGRIDGCSKRMMPDHPRGLALSLVGTTTLVARYVKIPMGTSGMTLDCI